ncbi:hypothetical protein ABS642_11745 [Microbacterium sp. A8/3-1]|uniref:Uncharacterized protein n=1 Tax=Microbacterium sp. A8/3-1 TaxID=3160749 RepID=A0AAU7VRA5_9MICO
MSAIKPIIREVKQSVLKGFAHAKDKLHQLADNMTKHVDDVAVRVRGQDKFDGPGGNGGGSSTSGGPHYTHGVRFFGQEQLTYYTRDNATLGAPGGDPVFMMPAEDAVNVSDSLDAAIESGMAPSVMNAWRNGEPVYGAMIPVDHLPQWAPTAQDAGGYEHYLPGGQTAVNIGGEHFQNPTREFVVPSGSSLETGTVVFELKDGGVWDIVGVYGR